MLSSKDGQYFVIAGFAMAIFFVIALFAIIVYWIKRIRKTKSNKNMKDHDEMDVEVIGHIESVKQSSDNEIIPDKEETEDYEDMLATALLSGINLIVYSCMPKSKTFKLLLAESKQSGSETRIGVFNQGKTIKKDTVFGPLQLEKEFFLIQIRKKKKIFERHKKTERGKQLVGFYQQGNSRRHEYEHHKKN